MCPADSISCPQLGILSWLLCPSDATFCRCRSSPSITFHATTDTCVTCWRLYVWRRLRRLNWRSVHPSFPCSGTVLWPYGALFYSLVLLPRLPSVLYHLRIGMMSTWGAWRWQMLHLGTRRWLPFWSGHHSDSWFERGVGLKMIPWCDCNSTYLFQSLHMTPKPLL